MEAWTFLFGGEGVDFVGVDVVGVDVVVTAIVVDELLSVMFK